MKKQIFILFALLLIAGSSFAQSGFNSENLRIGAGFNYASEISTAGLSLTGIYEFSPQLEGSVQFTHFFEKDYVKWSVFDFDGHYIFHSVNPTFNVYGLAGLAITRYTLTIPAQSFWGVEIPETSDSGSNIGLNLGVGANLGLTEQLNLAPELRYTITDGGYVRFGATLQYMF